MLTKIEGVYEKGKVILKESPPQGKNTKVLVTFMDDVITSKAPKRALGTMKGTIKMTDDFNENLDDLADYI